MSLRPPSTTKGGAREEEKEEEEEDEQEEGKEEPLLLLLLSEPRPFLRLFRLLLVTAAIPFPFPFFSIALLFLYLSSSRFCRSFFPSPGETPLGMRKTVMKSVISFISSGKGTVKNDSNRRE